MYHTHESEKLPSSTALLDGLRAESFAIIVKGGKVFEGRSVNLNDIFFVAILKMCLLLNYLRFA